MGKEGVLAIKVMLIIVLSVIGVFGLLLSMCGALFISASYLGITSLIVGVVTMWLCYLGVRALNRPEQLAGTDENMAPAEHSEQKDEQDGE